MIICGDCFQDNWPKCCNQANDDSAPTNQYPRDLVPDCQGYLPIAVTDDGDTLCEQCVLDPTNPVHVAGPNDSYPDGWGVAGWIHSGACESLTVCAHCYRVLVEE